MVRGFLHLLSARTPRLGHVLVGPARGHVDGSDFAGHWLRRFWPLARRVSRTGDRPFAGNASRSGPDQPDMRQVLIPDRQAEPQARRGSPSCVRVLPPRAIVVFQIWWISCSWSNKIGADGPLR